MKQYVKILAHYEAIRSREELKNELASDEYQK
eukprot:CAMPEP_0170560494 /NCGR_PEP_ID=MMETSP0211-20121228/49240_1 /TAXON_ID=311385 /ORGANISM="Pseudokeronopsis sp., Strain OXSARD2" /LENGTH=31 /DNA_ID= /DNA_START= /DNA_END= /DNA_ORIENTATION=